MTAPYSRRPFFFFGMEAGNDFVAAYTRIWLIGRKIFIMLREFSKNKVNFFLVQTRDYRRTNCSKAQRVPQLANTSANFPPTQGNSPDNTPCRVKKKYNSACHLSSKLGGSNGRHINTQNAVKKKKTNGATQMFVLSRNITQITTKQFISSQCRDKCPSFSKKKKKESNVSFVVQMKEH